MNYASARKESRGSFLSVISNDDLDQEDYIEDEPETPESSFAPEQIAAAEEKLAIQKDKLQSKYLEAIAYRDLLQPLYSWSVADSAFIVKHKKRYEEITEEIKLMNSQLAAAQEDLAEIQNLPRMKHERKIALAKQELEAAQKNLENAHFIEQFKMRKLVTQAEKLLLEVHSQPLEQVDQEKANEAEQVVEFFTQFVSNLRGEYNQLERERRAAAPLPVSSGGDENSMFSIQNIRQTEDLNEVVHIHQSLRGEFLRASHTVDSLKNELLELEKTTPEYLLIHEEFSEVESDGETEEDGAQDKKRPRHFY